jgi:hypothetical protein
MVGIPSADADVVFVVVHAAAAEREGAVEEIMRVKVGATATGTAAAVDDYEGAWSVGDEAGAFEAGAAAGGAVYRSVSAVSWCVAVVAGVASVDAGATVAVAETAVRPHEVLVLVGSEAAWEIQEGVVLLLYHLRNQLRQHGRWTALAKGVLLTTTKMTKRRKTTKTVVHLQGAQPEPQEVTSSARLALARLTWSLVPILYQSAGRAGNPGARTPIVAVGGIVLVDAAMAHCSAAADVVVAVVGGQVVAS